MGWELLLEGPLQQGDRARRCHSDTNGIGLGIRAGTRGWEPSLFSAALSFMSSGSTVRLREAIMLEDELSMATSGYTRVCLNLPARRLGDTHG